MKKVNPEILHTLAKIAEANDNDYKVKFAAAVVLRNKIVSVGFNRMKSHPFQARFAKNKEAIYLHSEIDSIKNALREISVAELTKCDLYIARVKRPKSHSDSYVWGTSKPCSGCERAIVTFGIKKVVYTVNGGGYEVVEY